jgi:hypothetical protein
MKIADPSKHRERPKKWLLIFALCAAFTPLKSYSVYAQQPPCPRRPECRALRNFNTCTEATEGNPLLIMRVTDVSRGACFHQIVKLKPDNAAAHNLPEEIEMEFNGICLVFDGKVNSIIQMALREEHSLNTRKYSIGCIPREQ